MGHPSDRLYRINKKIHLFVAMNTNPPAGRFFRTNGILSTGGLARGGIYCMWVQGAQRALMRGISTTSPTMIIEGPLMPALTTA